MSTHAAHGKRWLALPIVLVAMTIGLYGVLGSSAVPYNVRELFGERASLFETTVFSIAVLWLGAGAALVSQLAASSRAARWALPLLATITALVGYVLLASSVTLESLADILGTPEWARAAGGGAVLTSVLTHAEYSLRYVALYAPLLLAITVFAAGLERDEWHRGRGTALRALKLFVYAVPMWLGSKLVVVDLAATDNLVELIEPHSGLGLPGEVYLLGVFLLLGFEVAFLSWSLRSRLGWLALAGLAIVLATFIGWHLLKSGLVSELTKYGRTFSGLDFLLAPDRDARVGKIELFARWAVLHAGAVGVIGIGFALVPWPLRRRMTDLR